MLTDFGKLCRKIRIDNNELLADMAKKLNVSSAFLSAVENGKKNVPDSWFMLISEVYGLTSDDKKILKNAIENSVTQVKILTQNLDKEDRDLVLTFARQFDKLEQNDKEKILKLLKK